MSQQSSLRVLRRLVLFSAAHAFLSLVLWVWTGAVAMGLGFKNPEKWTAWDHFQADVVPPFALAITAPGRFFLDSNSGWGIGIFLPWLLNSVLWATAIVAVWSLLERRRAT
jgi:hypothetical protein